MTDILKIFGPPGTGKTTRLLGIMEEELARGVEPERLAYLSFTVAARHEAKTRAMTRFGFGVERLPWFRTLHSTAYEQLGIVSGQLVMHEDLQAFGERGGYVFATNGAFTKEGLPVFGFNKDDKLLAFDHLRRHQMRTVEDAFKLYDEALDATYAEVKRFCDGYATWKAEEGRVDFTDLLLAGRLLPLQCDVVILDEAQDLSLLQWHAFWALAAHASRVYIAGDDDQAIYEWAGASPEAFIRQPGEVEVLGQSYRCPKRIATVAYDVIKRVGIRQSKKWMPRQGALGVVVYTDTIDSVDIPADGTVLCLHRNHAYAADTVRHLKALGLTFTWNGQRSVPTEAAHAILTWERLRAGKHVELADVETVFSLASPHRISQRQRDAFRQLVKEHGTATVTQHTFTLAKWPEPMFSAPWYNVLDRLDEDTFYLRKIVQRGGASALTAAPRIVVSTIHAAKGTEADHVLLDTRMTRITRQTYDKDPDAERRVWYVGVTRAKETLTLIGFNNPALE